MSEETYLLQQPATLQSMAIKKLGEWIASYGEKLAPSMKTLQQRYPFKALERLSRQIEIIRNHLKNKLPGRFHDDAMNALQRALSYLLNKVQKQDVLKTIVLKRLIETLFTKHITSLSFARRSDWEKFQDSFYAKPHLICGLRRLTLNCDCTDDVLQFVARNFILIHTLDLYFSIVNTNSIGILTRLKNLRSVNLNFTTVDKAGIRKLLEECPKLERIVTSREIDDVLEEIEYCREYNENKRFDCEIQFNLTCCMCLYATWESMQLVPKMLPFIEKMQFRVYEYRQIPVKVLSTLQNLQNLRELQLIDCKFYTYKVKEPLLSRGSNLVVLHLRGNSEIDSDALKHISVMCPNLQSLELYDCEYIDSEDLKVNDDISCEVEISPLLHLKKISVMKARYSDVGIVEECIMFLLSICPNIEYVNILKIGIRDMDSFISEVLENNPTKLMHLRELTISDQLSKPVIDQIVENCVNHPKIILRRIIIDMDEFFFF